MRYDVFNKQNNKEQSKQNDIKTDRGLLPVKRKDKCGVIQGGPGKILKQKGLE